MNDRLTAQPRAALRPDHRLPDRSVEEPELREGAGGRRRRAARGHQGARELRPRAEGRQATTCSRASASPTTSAATAATSSAAAGASTTTSATPTRTCCSRRSTRPASASARSSTSTSRAGIRNPDGSSTGRSAALEHRSQNQVDPSPLPLFGQWLDPRLECPTRGRRRSAGRTS